MNISTFYPIPGYENYYQINNQGIVQGLNRYINIHNHKRFYKHKTISSRIDRYGYVSIRLHIDGNSKTHFVHVLLAKTFIPNPFNKIEINHKNGIKTDNHIENLEWCTHQENMQHAYETGLIDVKKKCKPIIDVSTGLVYNVGIKNVAKLFSLSYSTCKNYLNGNRKNPTPLRHNKNIYDAIRGRFKFKLF